MRKSFLSLLYLIVIIGFSNSSDWNDEYYKFGNCDDTQDEPCTMGASNSIKITKADTSEFKRCPKTTHVCLEKGSQVYLNVTSRLFVKDYGVLRIHEGGSFNIFNSGFCRVWGRSYLAIGKNANVKMDDSQMTLSNRGEINNKGLIFVGHDSELHVKLHSFVSISASDEKLPYPGLLYINKLSIADLAGYSHITIYPSSELRTTENNQLTVKRYSAVELVVGNILMDKKSELEVDGYSYLEVGHTWCQNKTRLILGIGSEIKVKDQSSVKLVNGLMVMKEDAQLWIKGQGSLVLSGLLEIAEQKHFELSSAEKIVIGKIQQPDDDFCHDDASLIISNAAVIPRELVVGKGAHCFTKSEVSESFDKNARVNLKADSDTTEYKCFNSRHELMQALSRSDEYVVL